MISLQCSSSAPQCPARGNAFTGNRQTRGSRCDPPRLEIRRPGGHAARPAASGVAVAGFPWRESCISPLIRASSDTPPSLWVAFAAFAAIALAMALPLLWRVLSSSRDPKRLPAAVRRPFPWWGWVGVAGGGLAWLLAWTRFPWFSDFQIHTFTPLWIAYILVINALTYRRRGGCMLKDRPAVFPEPFPGQCGFLVVFRVPQPIRSELVLCGGYL